MLELNKIHNENAITGLKNLPDNSIDCCVTSPPYFGLRDYQTATWEGGDSSCKHLTLDNDIKNAGKKQQTNSGSVRYEKDTCKSCGAKRVDAQIGLEATPELFVEQLVKVFTEVKRVLKKEGTLWLNLGDSYWGGKGQSGQKDAEYQESRNKSGKSILSKAQQMGGSGITMPKDGKHHTIKPKDLIGVPWMVAFALRSSGWYLRQDIIWSKPNPMPESVTDRCTKAHEYIFLMSKSGKYYYDNEAIKTPLQDSSYARLSQDIESQTGSDRVQINTNGNMKAVVKGGVIGGKKHKNLEDNGLTNHSFHKTRNEGKEWESLDRMANKRSVWTVTTKPFSEAHFATFPQELICDMIKAGCPEGGVVLDPFMGAGTTALVARKLNRNYVGFELNPKYIKIAEKRLRSELGFFQ